MGTPNAELSDFFSFLLSHTYKLENLDFDTNVLAQSFTASFTDVKYYFPEIDKHTVWERVTSNSNELAIWLYRTGRAFGLIDKGSPLLGKIHWLLRSLWACEIYFSKTIGKRFYIFHGEGLAIGLRISIGDGL